MKQVKTKYHPEMNAHTALLEPTHGAVKVLVHVDRYEHAGDLDELFLYNFDADGNCIEFAFGTRKGNVGKKFYVTYTTDGAIHRPPFRIEISHQLDTVRLENYAFTLEYDEI